MPHKLLPCFGLLLCMFFGASANAQPGFITYTLTERSIEYTRNFQPSGLDPYGPPTQIFSESFSNNGLGSFDASIAGQAFDNGDPYLPVSEPAVPVAASQTSFINSSSITASGFFDSFGTVNSGAGLVQDISRSLLVVEFDLSAPTPFSVELASTGPFVGFARVTDLDDNFIFESIASANDSTSIQSGTLEAGGYRLFIDEFASFNGSFDINLQVAVVPEPSSMVLLGLFVTGSLLRRRRSL